MTVYIKVPEITPRCVGCAAAGSEAQCNALVIALADTPNRGCTGVIWIEDTEAARLAYITLKLEN